MLVCPVVDSEVSQWNIYLPAGRWYSLWDKPMYEGETTIEVNIQLDRIPVFVCERVEIPVFWGLNRQLGESVPFNTSANDFLRFG
ncbi:MAG: hypothetical protein K8I82_10055 [Anaerolineae bacterium]|nr:hypothetical protein [Anaerolineae bacterium]